MQVWCSVEPLVGEIRSQAVELCVVELHHAMPAAAPSRLTQGLPEFGFDPYLELNDPAVDFHARHAVSLQFGRVVADAFQGEEISRERGDLPTLGDRRCR